MIKHENIIAKSPSGPETKIWYFQLCDLGVAGAKTLIVIFGKHISQKTTDWGRNKHYTYQKTFKCGIKNLSCSIENILISVECIRKSEKASTLNYEILWLGMQCSGFILSEQFIWRTNVTTQRSARQRNLFKSHIFHKCFSSFNRSCLHFEV